MFHLLQTEDNNILHQQKDYDLLYCNTHFDAVIWNQTCDISEVYLYYHIGD